MKTHPEKLACAWPGLVELIGGPLCGELVNWPKGESKALVKYDRGAAVALYAYEGKGKAVYDRK